MQEELARVVLLFLCAWQWGKFDALLEKGDDRFGAVAMQ